MLLHFFASEMIFSPRAFRVYNQAKKCTQIIHSELDEQEFQKKLLEPPRSLTRKKRDPAEAKVKEWLRRRGMNSVGIGYLATECAFVASPTAPRARSD